MKNNDFPIDIVLPYVNCNDPIWINDFKRRGLEFGTDFHTGIIRYRDTGTLYYCIKSILKFLPWINKIHLIVSHESQVPQWCRKYVNVILHEDFIPKELCPCFNSPSIESFLGNLPVAEHFIYINDDMIFTNPIKRTFYFTKDGTPKANIYLYDNTRYSVSLKFRNRLFRYITGLNDENRHVWTEHGPQAFKLSWCKEFLNTHYNDLYESAKTVFRDENIYMGQYFYAFYQYFWKNTKPDKTSGRAFMSAKDFARLSTPALKKLHWICVNDSDDDTEIETKYILHKKLMHILN